MFRQIPNLEKQIMPQQSVFWKIKTKNEVTTRAYFWVEHLLAKSGQPFTNGELIKLCMIEAAEEMCSEINFTMTHLAHKA